MNRSIFITLAAFWVVLSTFSGCASARHQGHTCALILIMDGQQIKPSLAQFEAVERKLGTQFEQRSLIPAKAVGSLDATAYEGQLQNV